MNDGGRRYKIYYITFNLLVHYLAKFKMFKSAAVIPFKNAAKSITNTFNTKLLRKMASFHSNMYAELQINYRYSIF